MTIGEPNVFLYVGNVIKDEDGDLYIVIDVNQEKERVRCIPLNYCNVIYSFAAWEVKYVSSHIDEYVMGRVRKALGL